MFGGLVAGVLAFLCASLVNCVVACARVWERICLVVRPLARYRFLRAIVVLIACLFDCLLGCAFGWLIGWLYVCVCVCVFARAG